MSAGEVGRFLVGLIAVLALVGCVSLRPSSPYYHPRRGVLYEYGNFCGPSLPRFQTARGENVDDRIRTIQGIVAVDAIDQACKSHDLCYEVLGHDTEACDHFAAALLRETMVSTYNGQFVANVSQQCVNLAYEINLALIAYKPLNVANHIPEDPVVSGIANIVTLPFMVLSTANHAVVSGASGWPAVGDCTVSRSRLRDAYERSRSSFDAALIERGYRHSIPSVDDLMGTTSTTRDEFLFGARRR